MRFGPIVQMGYLVPDIERAARHWTETLGVGPFFLIEHTPFTELWYRGKEITADQSAALAQWGDMQIELVQQHDSRPCLNNEFAGLARGGLQHLGIMTPSVDDDRARCSAEGIKTLQWGAVGDIRFAFLDTGMHDGLVVELIEDVASIREFFGMVRDAAIGWNGRDPLRRVPLV